jgi:hypothetical protein
MTPKEQAQLRRENEHLSKELLKVQRRCEIALEKLHTVDTIAKASAEMSALVGEWIDRQDKLVELITLLARGKE